MDKEEFQLLMQELMFRPVAFHPALARAAGSANAGLFLSQLFYWHGKGMHPDGWIYKDHKEWTQETCLTEDEQRGARKLLLARELIEVSDVRKLKIDPFKSTLTFRINFANLRKCIMDGSARQSRMVDGDGKIPPRDGENEAPGEGDSHPEPPETPPHSTQSSASISPKAAAKENAAASPHQEKKRRRGDQEVVAGVEVWTPSDREGLERILAVYGEAFVTEVAAKLEPAPGHRAPYLSSVALALEEAEVALRKKEAEKDFARRKALSEAGGRAASKSSTTCSPPANSRAGKFLSLHKPAGAAQ